MIILVSLIFVTIKSSGYYDSNSFNLANLCYYVCLATLISVSKYVRK